MYSRARAALRLKVLAIYYFSTISFIFIEYLLSEFSISSNFFDNLLVFFGGVTLSFSSKCGAVNSAFNSLKS